MPIVLNIPILILDNLDDPDRSVWAIVVAKDDEVFMATFFRRNLENGMVQDMYFTRESFDQCAAWNNLEEFLKFMWDNYTFQI